MRAFLIFSVLFFQVAAIAGVDLTGHIIATKFDSVDGRLDYYVSIQNRGDEAVATDIRVRPFIMHLNAYPQFSEKNDPITLEGKNVSIDLQPGANQIVEFSYTLPTVPSEHYWTSVVLNSNQAQAETNNLNNATDLFHIGEISNEAEAPAFNLRDLTHEVRGEPVLLNGSLSHASRTIVRGSTSFDYRLMWGRFFAVNLETKKVYTLIYSGSDTVAIDKQWYAVSWNAEKNIAGQTIYVDYYSQSPKFQNFLPKGKYQFLTMINSRELVPESNPYNNMEAKPVEITDLTSKDKKSIWLALADGESAEKTISIQNNRREPITWTVTSINLPSQTIITPSSGTIAAAGTITVTLQTTVKAGNLNSAGKILFQSTADGLTFDILKLPVEIKSRNSTTQQIQVLNFTPNVTVTQSQPVATQTINITNSGTEKVQWSLQNLPPWIVMNQTAGSLGPSETVDVTIDYNSSSLRPNSNYQSILKLFTSESSIETNLTSNLRLNIQ